ncbi:MAG: hypothetical protein IT542_02210 [Rubellimicrobium sp.]|nr:hypothetical protein [Rubellimicrobium sp.]
MRRTLPLAILALALGHGALAQEGEGAPLSVIDWLSHSVESPPPGGATPDPVPDPNETPVTGSATSPEIVVRPLDSVPRGGIGLLPGAITGLPDGLWSGSDAATLVMLVRAEPGDTLPALRDLLTTLMLARAGAPADAGDLPGGPGDFFLARVDRLLDLGALDPAQALLEQAGREDAETFRRWFDTTLLTGTEDDACTFMETRPDLAPTWPARIFCLARRGDWSAAALTFGTARALGQIDPGDEALLARFLDPALAEDADPLPAPDRPSPLVYRMREAIGEPIAATGLPRAFAHADLRPVAPWRSQLEAAERLVRVGAVSPNVLFALYLQQEPAASGGIWDRARAIQALDAALDTGDGAALDRALLPAWQAMVERGAAVAFADYWGARILAAATEGGAQGATGALAWRIALLSADYEAVARGGLPDGSPDPRGDALLAAVAQGSAPAGAGRSDRESAVTGAFGGTIAPAGALIALAQEGRLGEALLRAIAQMGAAQEGDPVAMGEGLAFLRAAGLEDAARRVALEYLVLAPDTP